MKTRVAITGPESTGKSSLAKQLAIHYNDVWVQEYARIYIDKLVKPYTFNDVEQIAITQIQQERAALKAAKNILFADTELLVIKIWMEVKFGKSPAWIERKMIERKYDLYLLCNIDLPWEEDSQREHPYRRKELFELYELSLIKYGFNYRIINGLNEVRYENAISFVDEIRKV